MSTQRKFLPEVQGLRAVAVILVVLFHFWPENVTGGYVGVDVFFVISGFLITGQLVRTAERDGSISMIEFYSRRIRRLLPAATFVLIVCAVGTYLVLPAARWLDTAKQIGASAVYIQNWVLSWLAVNYLGAQEAMSPVEHYWSLSIEEQFYFVWPLVMIAAVSVARWLRVSKRRAFIVALSLIFVSSLVASIRITAIDPAAAYFVTSTRMWELALGGLLALVSHRVKLGWRTRFACMIAGFAAIVASAFVYSTATAFPGYTALLPTLGAVGVILGGDIDVGRFRGLNARPLVYLGDRSYSIYLWHVPFLVFFRAEYGDVSLLAGAALAALTLGVSELSYRYLEERYRRPKTRNEVKPFAYGVASIAVCVLAAGAIAQTATAVGNAKLIAKAGDYPGPAVLASGINAPSGVPLIPKLSSLKQDLPLIYPRGCQQDMKHAEVLHCSFGDKSGKKTIVLFGDSHAAQWAPALRAIAVARKWHLVTVTKSSCGFARISFQLHGKPYVSCEKWREQAIKWIKAKHPDIVFTSEVRRSSIPREQAIAGVRDTWKRFTAAGIHVVGITDTPRLPFPPGDCVNNHAEKCELERRRVEPALVYAQAANGLHDVSVVDMNDYVCRPLRCQVVVGNVITWRDKSHLSATYVTKLTPYLARELGLRPVDGASAPAIAGAFQRAMLHCEGMSGSGPFSRAVSLHWGPAHHNFVYRHGDWKGQRHSFAHWNGNVKGDSVLVTGNYREGPGGIKSMLFTGHMVDGQLELAGRRGPRDCTVRTKASS